MTVWEVMTVWGKCEKSEKKRGLAGAWRVRSVDRLLDHFVFDPFGCNWPWLLAGFIINYLVQPEVFYHLL